jgi:hypothetical protein
MDRGSRRSPGRRGWGLEPCHGLLRNLQGSSLLELVEPCGRSNLSRLLQRGCAMQGYGRHVRGRALHGHFLADLQGRHGGPQRLEEGGSGLRWVRRAESVNLLQVDAVLSYDDLQVLRVTAEVAAPLVSENLGVEAVCGEHQPITGRI